MLACAPEGKRPAVFPAAQGTTGTSPGEGLLFLDFPASPRARPSLRRAASVCLRRALKAAARLSAGASPSLPPCQRLLPLSRLPPARPACLSAFLAKITRNLAISKYRAKYAKKRTGDRLSESLDELGECIPVSNDNVSQAIDRRILAEAINGYLDTCSEKQRKIFVRRFFYFDSIAEISQMYGIGQSDVKVTLMRMRRSLQKILEEEELM